MLDPLSALGVVSNIVQLVSFTADIIAESRAYVKGNSRTISSYESIAQLVEQQQAAYSNITDIERTAGPLNREEQALKDVAERCITEGRELVSIIEGLEPEFNASSKRKLSLAMVTVVKARWKRSNIEKHRQALANYQDQLNFALVTLIRRDQGLHFAALREVIELQSDTDHGRILDARNTILETIEEQRRHHEASMQETLTKLADLTVSASETRNILLARQAQSQDDILDETISQRQQTTQIAEDIADGFAKLESDLGSVQSLLQTQEELEKTKKILASLHFPDLKLRQDMITEAHSETFEWIFSSNNSEFSKWLSREGGIFWVNGKAGSGKSTLMKFLVNDQRTKHLLRDWAGEAPVVVANFYFWYVGTPLQKSEEGLLRSILCQILFTCPELIPIATPRRWENASEVNDSWSLRELRQGVENLASDEKAVASAQNDQTQNCVPRFCFFIDGLDEYQADHLRLVELLQALSTKSTVKICVSSRPWNVFEQAFGNLKEQLVLEDLTCDDITLYVRHNLHFPFQNDDDMLHLADEVAAKAQGVFLWVYLAVRTLREGISEGDSISLLRDRVTQLPSDLRDYFQLIISRVHPVYKKSKTMTALYMAMSATRQELAGETYKPFKLTRSFWNFWILREGIDDPEFAIHRRITQFDSSTCDQFRRRTRTFLSAICKDLLYLPLAQLGFTADSQVEFLHRTVYEFLESGEMRLKVEAGTMPCVRGRHFDLSMALSQVKFVESKKKFFRSTFALIRDAAKLELSVTDALGKSLMDEIERVAVCTLQSGDSHIDAETFEVLEVLDALFKVRRHSYATQMLKTSKLIHQAWCYDSILRGALGLKETITFNPECINETFLDYLFSFNVNVNIRQQATLRSPWEQYLYESLVYLDESSPSHRTVDTFRLWKIAKILIQHGADLHGNSGHAWSAEEALRSFVPLEHQEELRQLYRTEHTRQVRK